MAGSFNHCVNKTTGELLVNEDLVRMLENGGDVYEAVEEMYGMVWWLAYAVANSNPGSWDREQRARQLVEEARQRYRFGLELSPGTEGRLEDEED